MNDLVPLPRSEGIRFFEKKGYRVGFHWGDVWQGEHARAFTVAKAMRLDLLQDIRREVDRAIREGRTYREFSRELMPILDRHGWTGFKQMTDPSTGEIRNVELGTPRRLRIIYDTNLRMANAAGRWETFERNKRLMPYLAYKTRDDGRVREMHAPWHNHVLPIDDPWWDTHFPPNGWRCRCVVIQLSKAQAERRELKFERPTVKMVRKKHPRTGAIISVPEGVDPGFAYNVGKSHMRGLTPPPRSGPLSTPRGDVDRATTPLAVPRRRPRSRLLSDQVTEAAAIDRFLKEFGTKRGDHTVFTDKIGQPVVIGDDFFRQADGSLKIGKGTRAAHVLLLADTIKDPDEIWWSWEKVLLDRDSGESEYRLRRRFIAHWRVAGSTGLVNSLVAVDIGADGWAGVTAFNPRARNYVEKQRQGTLAYIRKP